MLSAWRAHGADALIHGQRQALYLVRAEEELDAIVKEMCIEAPSNEAGSGSARVRQ
jgi:hypothetical protein